MTVLRSLLGCAALATFAAVAASDPAREKDKQPAGPVSYYKEVRRVLQQHCQGCHQPAKAQGGYDMTTHAALLKPGESGKAPVVAGQPEKSELFGQIIPQAGKKPVMPKNRDPLGAAEVALLRRWIAEGAKDDTPKSARDPIDEQHPPKYRLPPVLTSIDYSPDGHLLAVAGHHEVLLHQADGSGLVGRLVGLSERVQSLAFSPDGKKLAVAGGAPARFGEVQIWDVAKKKLRQSVPLTYDTLYGVSWSPDGSLIAFGCGDNTLRAIDAGSGKQVLFQGAHHDWVLGTVFTQDGKHVVSISRDMSMKLTVVKTQRFVDNVTSITPGALKGGLLALDRRPQKAATKVKGVDGQEKVYDEVVMGGSDGAPRLYKVHRVVQRVIGDDANKVRSYEPMPGRVFALRFSKDGSFFAAGSSLDGKGEVRVYSTDSGKLLSRLDKIGPVYAVAVHPSGKTIASAGFDGTVRLSDPATGKVIKEFVPVPLEPATP
jgi:mono/diheme cytochrome c family protein/DNA-binding beta-propeller fold protein YncE